MHLIFLFLMSLMILTPMAEAPAQTRAETVGRALEAELSREEKRAIQEALVWTGNYDGRIDGLFGRGTRSAIEEFQEQRGYRPTGYLRQRHVDRLFAERAAITGRFGWEVRRFPDLGMELGIPARLFGEPEETEIGLRFRSREGARPRAELLLYSAGAMGERAFERLREEVADRDRFSRDTYDQAGDGWFVFSGRSRDGISQYTYIVNQDDGVRGFSFRYDDDDRGYDVLNVAMYNSLTSFRAVGEPTSRAPEPPQLPRRDRGRGGQGVLINGDGIVLTAASVAAECRKLVVNGRLNAGVAAIDRDLDLAALRLDRREGGYPHVGLRIEPVQAGTDLDVFTTAADGDVLDTDSFPARRAGKAEDPLVLSVDVQRLERDSTGAAVIDGDGRLAGLIIDRHRRAKQTRPDRDGQKERGRDARNAYAAMAFLAFHGIEFGSEISGDNTRRTIRRATVAVGCDD